MDQRILTLWKIAHDDESGTDKTNLSLGFWTKFWTTTVHFLSSKLLDDCKKNDFS